LKKLKRVAEAAKIMGSFLRKNSEWIHNSFLERSSYLKAIVRKTGEKAIEQDLVGSSTKLVRHEYARSA